MTAVLQTLFILTLFLIFRASDAFQTPLQTGFKPASNAFTHTPLP